MGLELLVKELKIPDKVFQPDAGSIALAEASRKYDGEFLDIGTGSGFIAIVMYLDGKRGDASDISVTALECAKDNFNKFDVSVKLIESDLYGGIIKKYDIIIYNPPSNVNEKEHDRAFKNRIKSAVPKRLSAYLSKAYQILNAKDRINGLSRFIEKTKEYLNPEGALLISILNQDLEYIKQNSPDSCRITRKMTTPNNSILEIRYS